MSVSRSCRDRAAGCYADTRRAPCPPGGAVVERSPRSRVRIRTVNRLRWRPEPTASACDPLAASRCGGFGSAAPAHTCCMRPRWPASQRALANSAPRRRECRADGPSRIDRRRGPRGSPPTRRCSPADISRGTPPNRSQRRHARTVRRRGHGSDAGLELPAAASSGSMGGSGPGAERRAGEHVYTVAAQTDSAGLLYITVGVASATDGRSRARRLSGVRRRAGGRARADVERVGAKSTRTGARRRSSNARCATTSPRPRGAGGGPLRRRPRLAAEA